MKQVSFFFKVSYLLTPNPSGSDYVGLYSIIKNLNIKNGDVIVDVGSGKGRFILFLLSIGLKNKIIGVEINNKYALLTQKLFRHYKNVQIIEGDIINLLPRDVNIIYLFNPFDYSTMLEFKVKLENKDIGTKVIYNNCKYVHLFCEDEQWEVKESKAILSRKKTALITKIK